jgi:glucose/arabinose dehydrogenase
VQIDTGGYHLPTSIAFVPQPGSGPKDVLYYVAELRGAIKAVTNDRSIYTFADNFFELNVQEELPGGGGQVGLAGLCLDPVHGYVFATYAYQDDQKALRNNIIRFETAPGTFGLKPQGQLSFETSFRSSQSAHSHQIGTCTVAGDTIFASLGDGGVPKLAQDLSRLNGKIARLSLDGHPLPDNPFYQDNSNAAENFIWAYGFRNPFGLKLVDGSCCDRERLADRPV